MLIHNVYFWLKDGLDADQIEAFRLALRGLCDIPAARSVYVGRPAPTGGRAVVDDSYSFALTVVFDSIEGHDAYQVHPLHKAFGENNRHLWRKLVVYDAE